MNVALMCAARRAREASLAIGVPLTEPLRMRAEGEAWVAIGVPLIEPRPPRCFMIVAGIIVTTIIIMGEGPLATKILGLCMLWAFMIGLLWATFEACNLPDVDTTES
ncbi:hypothetical protein VPH35_054396 [Triticum aestivum]